MLVFQELVMETLRPNGIAFQLGMGVLEQVSPTIYKRDKYLSFIEKTGLGKRLWEKEKIHSAKEYRRSRQEMGKKLTEKEKESLKFFEKMPPGDFILIFPKESKGSVKESYSLPEFFKAQGG